MSITIRAKRQLLRLAGRLHGIGALGPIAGLVHGIWRGCGRSAGLGRLVFWLALESDRLDLSRQAVAHHAREGAGRREAAWAGRARRTLEDREPIDTDAYRGRLNAMCTPVKPAPDGALLYVLAGSLPQLTAGYAHRAQALARAMPIRGQPVVCATRPGFPRDLSGTLADPDAADAARAEVDSVTYHRLDAPRRDRESLRGYLDGAAAAWAPVIAQYRPRAVMAASNHVTALPALLAARRAGLPFIYEVRGFWELTRAARDPHYAQSLQYRNAQALECLVAAQADVVFTLNTPMADELARRGVPPARIRLLPNACDAEVFAPRPRDGALAARLGLAAGTPVIGYVGSFTQYEGLDDLLRACGRLLRGGADFHLLLVGDELVYTAHQPRLVPRLRRIIAEEGLEAHVTMPGRVPAAEVPRWYSLIDIAPFPRKPQSVTELVSPLKPLEAMAMGKLVIASDVGALADMVADGRTGLLFAKGDADALADALQHALADPARRARIGRDARAWVAAERGWDGMADRVRDAVDTLAG